MDHRGYAKCGCLFSNCQDNPKSEPLLFVKLLNSYTCVLKSFAKACNYCSFILIRLGNVFG